MRSPQRGRHTGQEGLGEQRGIEETRCIRAKVTLSCHACQGRGRRGGGGLAEAVTTPFYAQDWRGEGSLRNAAQGDPLPVATCRLGYRSLLDPIGTGREKSGAELEARLLLWGHFPKAYCVPDSGVRGCAGLAVGGRTRNKQWRRNLNLVWFRAGARGL